MRFDLGDNFLDFLSPIFFPLVKLRLLELGLVDWLGASNLATQYLSFPWLKFEEVEDIGPGLSFLVGDAVVVDSLLDKYRLYLTGQLQELKLVHCVCRAQGMRILRVDGHLN